MRNSHGSACPRRFQAPAPCSSSIRNSTSGNHHVDRRTPMCPLTWCSSEATASCTEFAAHTEPFSRTTIPSKGDVVALLEMAAGSAENSVSNPATAWCTPCCLAAQARTEPSRSFGKSAHSVSTVSLRGIGPAQVPAAAPPRPRCRRDSARCVPSSSASMPAAQHVELVDGLRALIARGRRRAP